MKKEDCYLLGKIIRTHGVKGDLLIYLDADDPKRYTKIKTLFVEKDEQLISFDITKAALRENIITVHLQGIEDMTRAEEFLKCDVYMPLSFLPKPNEKRFYFHEVINFKVVDKTKGEIGIFEKIFDAPQQIIAGIKNGDKTILVPMITEFIDRVDRKEKILYLNLPDGLVDLYLNS